MCIRIARRICTATRALGTATGRRVAINLIKAGMDTREIVARFERIFGPEDTDTLAAASGLAKDLAREDRYAKRRSWTVKRSMSHAAR